MCHPLRLPPGACVEKAEIAAAWVRREILTDEAGRGSGMKSLADLRPRLFLERAASFRFG